MSELTEREKESGVQVISRTADILNILAEAPGGMSYGRIAAATNLPRGTVQRLGSALRAVGLVQSGQHRGVALGPAFLRLVARVHTDVVTALRPGLEALSELTGESVVLSRMSGRHLSVVHGAVAAGELQVTPRLGLGQPLYQTAAGRALLALQPDEAVRALYAPEFRPPQGCAVQTPGELVALLAAVRESGVATDAGEMTEGVNAMAVGVRTRLGEFSVGLVLPSGRWEKKAALCRECLTAFGKRVRLELGE